MIKKSSEDAFQENDLLPFEKWLAAFRNGPDSGAMEGHEFLRQFHAIGFYEAYDIVATYAERSQAEILWFMEKRECGQPFVSNNYPELESVCTYCNRFFSDPDSIPCPFPRCSSVFCSKACLRDHTGFKHN